MIKLLSLPVALAFLAIPAIVAPAIAQKRDRNAICLKRCRTAPSKNWCVQNCTSKCNMRN